MEYYVLGVEVGASEEDIKRVWEEKTAGIVAKKRALEREQRAVDEAFHRLTDERAKEVTQWLQLKAALESDPHHAERTERAFYLPPDIDDAAQVISDAFESSDMPDSCGLGLAIYAPADKWTIFDKTMRENSQIFVGNKHPGTYADIENSRFCFIQGNHRDDIIHVAITILKSFVAKQQQA